MYKEIRTAQDVEEAWDGHSCLIREEIDSNGDPVVYVYPQLGRGYTYNNVQLHKLSCLNVTRDLQLAELWATSKGYSTTVIR